MPFYCAPVGMGMFTIYPLMQLDVMLPQPTGLTEEAGFANPCFTKYTHLRIPVSGDHQSKLTLMSESLRNDGRVWVPKNAEDCSKNPNDISEDDRDYYLERKYPSFG